MVLNFAELLSLFINSLKICLFQLSDQLLRILRLMRKALKIIAIILISLVILLGAAIYFIAHSIDSKKIKNQISTLVHDKTGRTLSVNGDLSWSFFPWIGFRIQNVTLSNPANFSTTTPFANLKEANISIRLLPLLSGKIAVRNISFDGLQVNLVKNAAGETNWSEWHTTNPSPAANPVPGVNKANDNDHDEQSLNISIADVTVVNSQLRYDDAQTNQHIGIDNFYLEGTNVGTQQLFPLNFSFDLNTPLFPKPLSVTFNGNFNLGANLQTFAVNQIDLTINDLELEGDLSAKNSANKITFQGDLHVMPMNLNKVLSQFNIKLPAFKDPTALQNVSSDLAFNGDQNSVSIKPLKVTVDNSNLTGSVDVKNFAAPAIKFKLDLDNFNADRYLPPAPAAPAPTKNSPANATAGTPTTASNPDQAINLPTEMLRKLNIDGTFNINQLVAAKLHLNTIALTLAAHQGLIQLAPMRANLYEGILTSTATLDARGAVPQYSFAATLSNVQAKDLLTDLIGSALLTGTANFDSALRTQGNSVNQLTNHLNGNGKFSFTKGILNGININYELARARAMLGKSAAPAKPAQDSTDFGQMTGTYQITSGVATNNDLLITNPTFTGKGNGTANLNTMQLNYHFKLNTTQIPELKNYKIPINISGTFKSPSINLDMQDILKQVFAQQRKQVISDQANKYLKNNKNAQQLLGNLLG
ncbi:MAG: AsmA family protein [Gammaproteobacteria bacterium]|nr:AsmA family protein [Gammaproteobacteria bacterium]